MSGEVDKLKKQLRDLTDLLDNEKAQAQGNAQLLQDFWRREPTVHLLWVCFTTFIINHSKQKNIL